MSEIYLGQDTVEESLAAQLPEFMPKDPESGNFKFFSTIAERLTDNESNTSSVDRAMSVQTADTIDQLERLSRLVDLKPYENEDREKFRARVLAEFQLVTCNGTVGDLLNATATILDTPLRTIKYTEEHTSGAGECQITVPGSKLDNLSLTDSDFAGIVDQLVPSSFRTAVLRQGTFTYISASDYNGGNFDPTKGYDGLDTNDDPKGNGGTYAGLLE